MKILFNWSDYLIPFIGKISQDDYLFDLFINSILFENDGPSATRVTRVVLDMTRDDESFWRWELPLNALEAHLSVEAKLGELDLETKKALVGSYLADKIQLPIPQSLIKPGEQALLRRFPIRFMTRNLPDKAVIRAYSGTHLIARNDIPVKSTFPSSGSIFPVKGVWQAINNFDFTLGHRQFAGQEFAIDLIQTSPDGTLRYNRSTDVEDYICFGKPVFAMTGGTVVRVHDGESDHPATNSEPLPKGMRMRPSCSFSIAHAGNYIQIQQNDDSFAFYSHLRNGSFKVSKGQVIEQGDVIAEIGNSGVSDFAHLHIHVNGGIDPMADRCLPLCFSNLKDIHNRSISMVVQNNSIVHGL